MSSDPEAIIYYGFPISDPEGDWQDWNEAWENRYRPIQPDDKINYKMPEWDEWREAYRKWQNTSENIEIDWSGGEDCEAFYVHCVGLKRSVVWNEQISLSGFKPDPQPEADKWLKKFCGHHGIEYKQPEWHLAARYF